REHCLQLSVRQWCMTQRSIDATQGRLRTQPGALQSQWIEHALDDQLFPSPAAHPLEHRACQCIPHIGVRKLRTRLRWQRLLDSLPEYAIAKHAHGSVP